MTHLLGVDDLGDDDVDEVLDRAEALAAGASSRAPGGLVVTLPFLTPSMRTRVGFEIAARRLGGTGVHVSELRVDTGMSASESLVDALRVLGGMSDVVVVRTSEPLVAADLHEVSAPVLSGGDAVEHPTQALIDLAALRRVGDLSDLDIALCGDLRMRAATSLLRLLARWPPRRLRGVFPPGRGPAAAIEAADPDDVSDVDVLVMIGLPPGRGQERLDDDARAHYALSTPRLRRLAADAVVLSPMPVIDEMAPEVRDDPRLQMFQQSDHGLFVRMAVLEKFATHARKPGAVRR